MALDRTRFRGKVKIHGRPNEQAGAEIRMMNAKDQLEQKRLWRKFFIILDILVVSAFGAAIYSFYVGRILNGFLSMLVGVAILAYFEIKKRLK